MESIHIQETVRPIRFAFLVSFKHPHTLSEAISYSTALWGGMFNPLIPIWRKFPFKYEKNRSFGLIEDFDPDFIVNLLPYDVPKEFSLRYSNIIKKEKFIRKTAKNQITFLKGISILPLLRFVWEKQTRTIKGHSRVILPIKSPPNNKLNYWDFVFGKFPSNTRADFLSNFRKALKTKDFNCKFSNIQKVDLTKIMSPIQFSSYTLNRYGGGIDGFSSHIIFVGRHNNVKDLLEYWNIRAAGKEIIFVPPKYYKYFELSIKHIAESGNYPINESIQNYCDIQKGSSITGDEYDNISKWIIKISNLSLPRRSWLPNWGRRIERVANDINPCKISDLQTEEISLLDNQRLTPFKTISPSILEKRIPYKIGEYSWALEIELRGNYRDDLFFRLPYNKSMEDLIKHRMLTITQEAKLSRKGVVLFPNYFHETEHLFPLKVWEVFSEHFKYYGMEITPSPAGIFAQKIIDKMDGLDGCRIFKIRGVREVLKKLSDPKPEKRFRFGMIFGDLSAIIGRKRKDKGGGANWDEKLYKGWSAIPGKQTNVSNVITYLFKKNILRAGLKLRCNNCQKEEWYHIGEFSENYTCKYCFQNQHIGNLKDNNWRYKADGLFMIPNTGEGSLSVICSLWRLKNIGHFDFRGFKYITSIFINSGQFEIDYAVINFSFFKTDYDLVIGEARNYKNFSERDAMKLVKISKKFPKEPFLSFTTLKEEFTKSEKDILKKLVDDGYQVIAMTRQEIDPYDLYGRFEKVHHKYAHTLKEFSENTIQLNLL